MVFKTQKIYSVLKVHLQYGKSGDNSGEATPVPISNTEVKLLSADDIWWEAAWESRTLPVFLFFVTAQSAKHWRFFLFFAELSIG